ncbi:class I SAM-dependent methyltransferase [Vallitalea sp.]|jgi:ubiquinone/menaquinone biosynthesis C-methylase UbiE|uniref:methyltransferase domain-containing protein n=1 Tax=Vallitalea sp. TaxID=1882829 RepID=UPI0025F9CA10|nr:class I SAM-dependent methyltransferase [Vallitalea sp.]MCT4688873.1 class I SAM-dependent methyltransferase [Vallitalea sp.]
MIEYSNIAKYYDQWSSGDKYWNVTKDFYVAESKHYEGPIVELGIGTARITTEILKKYSIDIIGVDRCKEMLEESRRRIAKEGLLDKLTLLHQDFVHLQLPYKSKYIFMPFRTFGHLPCIQTRKKALTSIYNNLCEGGVFIFDHYILDEEWAKSANNRRIKMYESDDILIEDLYTFDFNNKKLHCSVFKNNTLLESFDFYWFQPSEIMQIIKDVGFKVKALYGDFHRNQLTKDSYNQIWVLER